VVVTIRRRHRTARFSSTTGLPYQEGDATARFAKYWRVVAVLTMAGDVLGRAAPYKRVSVGGTYDKCRAAPGRWREGRRADRNESVTVTIWTLSK
jgi:hypothetical protein